MRVIKLSTTLAILALAGCIGSQSVPSQQLIGEMSDWPEFSIRSPATFLEHIKRDDGSVALTTYDTSTTARKSTDFSVHLYPSGSSCQNLGKAYDILSIEGKEAAKPTLRIVQTGHTQFSDKGDFSPECPQSTIFCSSYQGKQVAICLHQQSIDGSKPWELARDIFSTFRWTAASGNQSDAISSQVRTRLQQLIDNQEWKKIIEWRDTWSCGLDQCNTDLP